MPKEFPGEKLLIKVIDDLADFLPYLVLVGGWVPYIYARYIWKDIPSMAVTTGDIDFGVGDHDYNGKDTIASRVQRLGYGERHASMDRMIPFVPIVKDASGDAKAELRKDLYYIYYMLRFSPAKARLYDDVIALINKRKEGKRVKENLKEYFDSVDSNGPLFIEQENGPDVYIANVREDAFERFSDIRRRVGG